jgi:hypothetical protein
LSYCSRVTPLVFAQRFVAVVLVVLTTVVLLALTTLAVFALFDRLAFVLFTNPFDSVPPHAEKISADKIIPKPKLYNLTFICPPKDSPDVCLKKIHFFKNK